METPQEIIDEPKYHLIYSLLVGGLGDLLVTFLFLDDQQDYSIYHGFLSRQLISHAYFAGREGILTDP